jgi:drug/metabolite transporter (DMT)-like permease
MAVLWGSTFFSIKRVVDHIPVADFLAVRFLISGILLTIIFRKSLKMSRKTFIQGLFLGVLWAVAQLLQTQGLSMTSASISGFVTGLYVVFTPVIAWIMYRSKLGAWTWVAVGLATVGLAALTIHPTQGDPLVGQGEILTVGCAIMYAVHIVIMGRWSTPEEAGALSIGQSLSMTVVFFIAAAPGGITLPTGIVDWAWMMYLAVLCGALTLLIQTWAQGLMDATKAAVIMCSEPLWATFFAILFGGERPGWMFALGAVAILGAMYLVIRPPVRHGQAATPVA